MVPLKLVSPMTLKVLELVPPLIMVLASTLVIVTLSYSTIPQNSFQISATTLLSKISGNWYFFSIVSWVFPEVPCFKVFTSVAQSSGLVVTCNCATFILASKTTAKLPAVSLVVFTAIFALPDTLLRALLILSAVFLSEVPTLIIAVFFFTPSRFVSKTIVAPVGWVSTVKGKCTPLSAKVISQA